MGGDLVVREETIRMGATFTLILPVGKEGAVTMALIDPDLAGEEETVVLAPSARLLVDMTEILADRSLDRLVAGLHKLFSDLLGAQAGLLVVRHRSGELNRAGSFGPTAGKEVPETPIIKEVMSSGVHVLVPDLAENEPAWAKLLRSKSALFLPVHDDDDTVGVLVVGWDADVEPSPRLLEIANALARLAAFGAQRAALAAEVLFERQMRSTVLEVLPIAISIFAGDPPIVVDWNEAERRLLGIRSDEQRPSNLALSQEVFDVRFLDGTPLTMENSPVVQTIRAGKTMGPFTLRIRRADNSEVVARAYCAPFFENGLVAGAVVTSEEIEIGEGPSD
jgi:PAS domain-containing protein